MDAAWSAWLANMANANQVTGALHCCYAIGAAVAPLIATLMFTKGQLEWYYFYYLMVRFEFSMPSWTLLNFIDCKCCG